MSVVAAVGPGAAVAAYGHGQPLCGGGARKRKDVRDHEVGLPGSDGRAAAAGLFVLETVEEEEEEGADAERSSSVGAASEDDAEEEEEEEDGDEVDSGGTRWTAGRRRREGGALEAAMDMGALDDALPIKRGLSSFFSGRSRSFANLLDAASAVGSARDLAKPENPFNKRRRVLRCCSVRRAASTTSLAALPPIAGGDDNDDDGRSVPS